MVGDAALVVAPIEAQHVDIVGFSTPEIIKIATQNGATYLGLGDRIGSIAIGKQADLVLLDGDLAKDISVIENPELVFKAGVAYDSQAIYSSLRPARITLSKRAAGKKWRFTAELIHAAAEWPILTRSRRQPSFSPRTTTALCLDPIAVHGGHAQV